MKLAALLVFIFVVTIFGLAIYHADSNQWLLHKSGSILIDTKNVGIAPIEYSDDILVRITATERDGKPFRCFWVNATQHQDIAARTLSDNELNEVSLNHAIPHNKDGNITSALIPRGKHFIYFFPETADPLSIDYLIEYKTAPY